MKKLIFASIIIFFLGVGYFSLNNIGKIDDSSEQLLLENTKNISKEYVALRFQTDNILLNAKNYSDYETWNNQITKIINEWQFLETESIKLEKLATEISLSDENISFEIFSKVLTYDKQEISNIYDKAPAGKKIATLAKHLGVDAKMAFKILQQDQAQVEADAWNDAGDTFQKLETSAVVIKDTCKVATFVGTIALTGGTAAIIGGSTIGQAAVVVSGADLVLEITDDGAKIALGNNNKISKIVGDIRVVTEPASSLLMITDLPQNLTKGIHKLGAISFGLDQFNSSVQEGKVIGIKLPAYSGEKPENPSEVSIVDSSEIKKWITEQGVKNEPETLTEIEKILEINNDEIEVEKNIENTQNSTENDNTEVTENNSNENNSSATGIWEGIIKFTPSMNAQEEQKTFSFSLNDDKTVDMITDGDGFISWEQQGNIVKVFAESEGGKGYYEFNISGDKMTFVKLAGPNSEGKWQENLAGSDFFGGKFMQIELIKQ